MRSRTAIALLLSGTLALPSCGGGAGSSAASAAGAASAPAAATSTALVIAPGTATDATAAEGIDAALRRLLAANGIARLPRAEVSDAMYSLGLNLFQSTLLSGNQRVSCASCHSIGNAGLDNLVLGIGVNGSGGPPARTGTPLLHRNTPSLLNLGLGHRGALFRDGRVAERDGALVTPAGSRLPAGLLDVVAAQALFPLLSRTEMLGPQDPADDNAVADLNPPGEAVESNPRPVWDALMQRVRVNASLAPQLVAAYPGTPLSAMGIEHAANAIAAFEKRRWYALGDTNQLLGYAAGTRDMSDSAKRGGLLFFDKARCASCHTGPLLSDQKFHNIAAPQMGPGFASGALETPAHDRGRYDVTGNTDDLYAFLTPSLWEVKNTFPYLHSGAYATLEATVRHHLYAARAALAFRCAADLRSGGNAVPCSDSTTAPALYADMVARLAPALRTPVPLSDAEIADLVAFLNVLTDGNNTSMR